MDAETAARRWADIWSRAWPQRDAEAIAALHADTVVYRLPRSASRTWAWLASAATGSVRQVTAIGGSWWNGLANSAARFLATAQALTDGDVHQASALPGWDRAHVLTHVAQAADSRTRLLRAVQASRVSRQYPSEQARAPKPSMQVRSARRR